jgi:hypothetical protein
MHDFTWQCKTEGVHLSLINFGFALRGGVCHQRVPRTSNKDLILDFYLTEKYVRRAFT